MLYDARGAGGWLCLSQWTVRKLEQRGLLRAVRLGGAVRYEEEELRAYVERCKAQPGPKITRRSGEPPIPPAPTQNQKIPRKSPPRAQRIDSTQHEAMAEVCG